jgi:hypothetical protein
LRGHARGIDHPAAKTGSAGRADEPSQSPPDQNWHANRKLRTGREAALLVFKQTLCHCAGFGPFGKPQAFRSCGVQSCFANQIVDNQSTYCGQL